MTRTFSLAVLSILTALTLGTTTNAAPLATGGSVATQDAPGLVRTVQYHHRHHHHGGGHHHFRPHHHHGWGHHHHFRPHHHHGWGHHHHHRRHHHHF